MKVESIFSFDTGIHYFESRGNARTQVIMSNYSPVIHNKFLKNSYFFWTKNKNKITAVRMENTEKT